MAGTNAFNARTLSWLTPKGRAGTRRDLANDEMLTLENYRKIFIGRFDWIGADVPAGYIENIIFMNGVAFYHNSASFGGVFCTGGMTEFNANGQPTRFTLNFANGKTALGTSADTVPIYDTPFFYNITAQTGFATPFMLGLRYSELVSSLLGTANTYAKGLKKPTIIPTTDKTEETNKIVAEQILQDHPFIFVSDTSKGMSEPMTVFHNTTHKAEDLNGILTARKTLFSEGLQRLGVRGSLLEKKAYRSDTDNDREDLSADLVLDISYRSRLVAVKQIRAIGGDISVNITEPLRSPPDETPPGRDE